MIMIRMTIMIDMTWTIVTTKGKQIDYFEFETLEQMNRILKREYNIQIEYIEGEFKTGIK